MNSSHPRALPLRGIRVIEIGNYIAGPGTSMILGDLGADVIKIEAPGGDMARHAGLYGDAMVRAYNRSKKSISLDLRVTEGIETARRLISTADVVVQNLRPGAVDALNLGSSTMRAAIPRLIYASITGFPSTGPSRNRPGYDIAAQAESGLMSVTGDPQGMPQKVGAPIIDTATAQVAAQAILAALFRRERDGIGETIEISLLEVALHLQLPNWSDFLVRGVEPERTGDGQPLNAPAADIVKTKDGLIVISAYIQSHWKRLCQTIGRFELADDPRFRTNELRVANRLAMKAALNEALSSHTTEECVNLLTENNIVVGVVRPYQGTLESADFASSSMFIDVEGEGDSDGYRSFGLPYRLQDTPRRATSSSPATGIHGAAILLEAGFRPDEVDRLQKRHALIVPEIGSQCP